MLIAKNRTLEGDKLTFNYFDMQFKQLPFQYDKAKASPLPIEKPDLGDEMLDVAAKLAKPFPYVRMDLYVINNKIKVGELTFYPGAGLDRISSVEWDIKLGNLLTLPKATPWK